MVIFERASHWERVQHRQNISFCVRVLAGVSVHPLPAREPEVVHAALPGACLRSPVRACASFAFLASPSCCCAAPSRLPSAGLSCLLRPPTDCTPLHTAAPSASSTARVVRSACCWDTPTAPPLRQPRCESFCIPASFACHHARFDRSHAHRHRSLLSLLHRTASLRTRRGYDDPSAAETSRRHSPLPDTAQSTNPVDPGCAVTRQTPAPPPSHRETPIPATTTSFPLDPRPPVFLARLTAPPPCLPRHRACGYCQVRRCSLVLRVPRTPTLAFTAARKETPSIHTHSCARCSRSC